MSKVRSHSNPASSGIEQATELVPQIAKQTVSEFGSMGASIFKELIGLITPGSKRETDLQNNRQKDKNIIQDIRNIQKPEETSTKRESSFKKNFKLRPNEGPIKLFSAFEYREMYEVPRRIEQILENIRQEIEAFRKTAESFSSEVENISKATINQKNQKLGQYDISFFEFLLSLIRDLRQKAAESKGWLATFRGKMQKRGSLFLSLKKKKGNSYAFSDELKLARSSN
ncbi:MAG: hypothetical protein KatS3mg091_112 [Patescibacteria group bacterium]|nr:MAG: hypothetical protein KatS3mg091_112 [Patescibacteria group bacterium]